MIGFKWIMIFVFGFVFLALSVVPSFAQADVPAVCLIGDHPGIPESDAQTAALLVCDELRKQGISITDPCLRGTRLSECVSRCFAPSGREDYRATESGKTGRHDYRGAAADLGKYRRDDPSSTETG